MERSVVLIIVKSGIVQDVQCTDAEALVVVRDEDAGGEITTYEWPETQWGDELDQVLKELDKDES
ncbi:hypothetical protein EDD75_0299 [Thermodesulfitimonas autotrophica]|uniref:Uncharacterized protein n=1 Tax=Thermodesulfitimonas autotrophica TaxID=1894989 RepID=A0A3N5AX68_9THEO|nr:hypothetical protein [Thermodesulfitimonas autotrophica]RPF49483.1 hypothetical protein EDD75_0299 [Thermodesulfitimonas autotrophica]